jgi:4,5-DOPA dioxygenase extradiol
MAAPSALFVSHGSPMLLLETTPTTAFLRQLGQTLDRPAAVIAVSAHWNSVNPAVGGAAAPETIHDFSGFPPDLYARHYPAPGAPALARRVADLLGDAARLEPGRGLDHGIWSVASLLWPEADIPIVPMAVQPQLGPAHHHALGLRLRSLAAEGVLVLGSGSLTHNLAAYGGHGRDDPAEPWVTDFTGWVAGRIADAETDALLECRARAPHAARNHPTDEHLLPLFVALGAGGGHGTRLHHAVEYGVIAMDAYAFDAG